MWRVLNCSGSMLPRFKFGIKQVNLCFYIEVKRFPRGACCCDITSMDRCFTKCSWALRLSSSSEKGYPNKKVARCVFPKTNSQSPLPAVSNCVLLPPTHTSDKKPPWSIRCYMECSYVVPGLLGNPLWFSKALQSFIPLSINHFDFRIGLHKGELKSLVTAKFVLEAQKLDVQWQKCYLPISTADSYVHFCLLSPSTCSVEEVLLYTLQLSKST